MINALKILKNLNVDYWPVLYAHPATY
jgi:hypothetical protein